MDKKRPPSLTRDDNDNRTALVKKSAKFAEHDITESHSPGLSLPPPPPPPPPSSPHPLLRNKKRTSTGQWWFLVADWLTDLVLTRAARFVLGKVIERISGKLTHNPLEVKSLYACETDYMFFEIRPW